MNYLSVYLAFYLNNKNKVIWKTNALNNYSTLHQQNEAYQIIISVVADKTFDQIYDAFILKIFIIKVGKSKIKASANIILNTERVRSISI